MTQESFGEEAAEAGDGQLVTKPAGLWQSYWDDVGNCNYYYNTVRALVLPIVPFVCDEKQHISRIVPRQQKLLKDQTH